MIQTCVSSQGNYFTGKTIINETGLTFDKTATFKLNIGGTIMDKENAEVALVKTTGYLKYY